MDMANAVLQYTALSQAKQAINQKLLLFIDSEIAILKKAYKKILRQPIFDKDIPTSKKRVLLVEDSLFIQHIHHTMLKSMGCHVDIANQGVEAIQLSQNKYDIILMDVGLPDMSGIEVTSKIRKRDQQNQKKVPIFALTTHTESCLHQQCLDAGMDGVFVKPISRARLKKLIHKS